MCKGGGCVVDKGKGKKLVDKGIRLKDLTVDAARENETKEIVTILQGEKLRNKIKIKR